MRLQLNHFSPKKSFRSRDDFSQYSAKQIEYFESLNASDQAAYNAWGKQLRSWWAQAKSWSDNGNADDDAFMTQMKGACCVEFNSPIFTLLEKHSDRRLNSRINGVLRFVDPNQDNQNLTVGVAAGLAEAAAVAGVSTRIGKTSTGKMLEHLLDEHEASLNLILDKDASELENQRQEFLHLQKEIEEQFEAYKKVTADFMINTKGDWSEAYNSYVEQLKTETAVELWEKRAEAHDENYKVFRKWTALCAAFGGAGGLLWIFGGIAIAQKVFADNEAAQLAVYAAGSVTLFTLLIWLLRVLVRSMISENHLATDASARSAMAHTYLALTKEDKASRDDRAIILASLFAPVADGLVKDDGMPILSPTAIAAAAVTNPKS